MIAALALLVAGAGVFIDVEDARLAARLQDELALLGLGPSSAEEADVVIATVANGISVALRAAPVPGEEGPAPIVTLAILPVQDARDVIAVRVSELIRAEWARRRDTDVPPHVPRRVLEVREPIVSSSPPRSTLDAVVFASLGVAETATSQGASGVSAAFGGVRGRGGVRLSCCLDIGVSAFAPLAPARLVSGADVALLWFGGAQLDVGAHARLLEGEGSSLDLTAGAVLGASWLHGEGQGPRARSVDGVVGTLGARGEAQLRVLPWLGIFAEAQAGLLGPQVHVALGGRPAAVLGPAWGMVVLGVAGAIGELPARAAGTKSEER